MNPNDGDGLGYTPLMYAIISPLSTRISIPRPCALGADLNQPTFARGRYWSPLRIALKCERWELAEQLIANRADPEKTTHAYASISHPLSLALLTKSPKNQKIRKMIIIKLLETSNPNIKVVSNPHRIGSLLSIVVRHRLQQETKLLLRACCVEVKSRDSSGLTPLSRALSPFSGSSEVADLLPRHGARILPKPVAETRLLNLVYQTPVALAIKTNLDYKKALAPLFQVLLNHCSSLSLENSDAVITAFLDGCPPWMVAVTKRTNRRVKDEYILHEMKEQFEIVEERPRKAKVGEMRNQFMHKGSNDAICMIHILHIFPTRRPPHAR